MIEWILIFGSTKYLDTYVGWLFWIYKFLVAWFLKRRLIFKYSGTWSEGMVKKTGNPIR